MVTDVLLGRDCVIEVAAESTPGVEPTYPADYNAIDLARDVTMNREKTEIDVTNRESAASGYTAKSQGLKSFSVEFEAHKEADGATPSTGMAALRAAWADNSTIWVYITHGNDTTKAACKVGGGSMAQPLDDAVTESFTLTNIGAVTDA